ncbi:MAG: hypothetical protein LBH20_01405 [Treponema sp.]|jgi:hypothetical protein|nr:hypothetical protein [Treponema sp.]
MAQRPGWLTIQRISLFLFLACGVALLVYALGFITDVYLFYAYGSKVLVDFYREMQGINTGLLWKAVLIIIFASVLFLLELGKHPAGKFTVLLVLIMGAASLLCGASSLALLAEARHQYTGLDLRSLNRYIERGAIQYRFSTFTYDLGLGGYALLLFSSLFMAVVVTRNAFTVRETISDKGTAHEKK